jgi:hypothetical protein
MIVENRSPTNGFAGLHVLALESRRTALPMARLESFDMPRC